MASWSAVRRKLHSFAATTKISSCRNVIAIHYPSRPLPVARQSICHVVVKLAAAGARTKPNAAGTTPSERSVDLTGRVPQRAQHIVVRHVEDAAGVQERTAAIHLPGLWIAGHIPCHHLP